MVSVFFLIIHVIVSTVNGLDADVWREKNEKRLLLLEKFTLRKKMRIFKFFISEAQREKKIFKLEVKDVVERLKDVSEHVNKCEEAIPRQDEDKERNLERVMETWG